MQALWSPDPRSERSNPVEAVKFACTFDNV
jgi:hypothetical protein